MISKTGATNKKQWVFFVAIGAFFVTALVRPTLANATGITGAASQIEYNPSSSYMLIQLNGNTSINYTVNLTSPGCSIPAVNIDSVKIFLSIAQGALLSGKNLTIYYTTCGTGLYVQDLVLAR